MRAGCIVGGRWPDAGGARPLAGPGGPLIAPLLLLAAGCFTPAPDPIEFETLRFQNEHTRSEDIVLRPMTYDQLLCPDEEPATFYAVYREGLAEAAPIVVFFHAGAFDYVPTPDPLYPTEGAHYAGEDQLSAEWAADKVFETFGLLPGVSTTPSETNTGALAAALADAGAFTLYPANCWGDLWHNEDSFMPNDWGADGGVHRQGRFFAWMMTRFASTDDGATWRERFGLDTLDVPLQSGTVWFVGLGEGGRAVVELYRREEQLGDYDLPNVGGVLVDSTPDNLYPMVSNPSAFAEQVDGLERIFTDQTTVGANGEPYFETTNDIGRYSLARWIPEQDARGGLDHTVELWWSSQDPRVPDETLSGLVALDSTYTTLITMDTQEPVHVQLNDDIVEAREAVDRLLGL